MRLWSLHPCYLDRLGLVALWRETLLAQAVLHNETKGYRNHPQLKRFRVHAYTGGVLCAYLNAILQEANNRNYKFNAARIRPYDTKNLESIPVTTGQLEYEWNHLNRKLQARNHDWFLRNENVNLESGLQPNPIFEVIDGLTESWESVPVQLTHPKRVPT
ncbi:MAG: DNA lyase [Gammaproteobacteria bacterium]|nr:DNA lyase [Gammaproteobacteria bacterium]MYF52587.1 DNA lyase [Gammaproteobacteria bacterium]MYK43554.1 DNA lyase [Gammaproteobacteria bacterium]